METAVIVKVAVSAAPYSIDKPYSYLVPEPLLEQAVPGVRVTIPFGQGNTRCEGLILTRSEGDKTPKLKPIERVLDAEPVLDGNGISLALWIRQRYFCTLYDAARMLLPPGLWYQYREIWSLTPQMTRSAIGDISIKGSREILAFLLEHDGRADLDTLKEQFGEDITAILKRLEKEGILCSESNAKRKISDKTKKLVSLAVPAEEALLYAQSRKRTSRLQHDVIQLLTVSEQLTTTDISYFTGASMPTLRSLEKAGILTFSEAEAYRVPVLQEQAEAAPIVLNEEQQSAYDELCAFCHSDKPEVVLLHGVTGSGKTQVYLRLVQHVLDQGKNAMVLVPEIVLTPQMMQKFSSYFGNRVAMLHSSLKMSERYDQWKRIRRGDVQVVLGTRSAIFAPMVNLGLIIMDEEQEGSYQSENPPRYHTRDVAKYLCSRDSAVLVLGSATPAVETAWAADNGIYRKLQLRRRYNENALPQVMIADLREEIRAGNSGMIGQVLRRELEKNLENHEQSILFLNRRGNSRMLLCGECGHIPQCPRCSVALTYHSANGRLMCHYCGYSQRTITNCPDCGGLMKQVGAGTQKVEEELQALFPDTAILRMDADTTTQGHAKILNQFTTERVPILLGTQMVAKGLDFENVTLVGVLSADTSLYVDHYRAAERTFSLLTQVVGRAGRGAKLGRAVIQTYTPGNDVIQSAAAQDYESFYNAEIRMRQLHRYPPFSDLFTFTVSGLEEGRVLRAAAMVRDTLKQAFAQTPELSTIPTEILGPSPAPVVRVNQRYRYCCTMIGKNNKETRSCISWLLKSFSSNRENRGLNLYVDCNMME